MADVLSCMITSKPPVLPVCIRVFWVLFSVSFKYLPGLINFSIVNQQFNLSCYKDIPQSIYFHKIPKITHGFVAMETNLLRCLGVDICLKILF